MSATVALETDPGSWQQHLFGLPPERWAALAGQSFWITGAGTGYGRCMAVALAAAGAQVFITGRRGDKLQGTLEEMRRLGVPIDRCHPVVADITCSQQLASACHEVRQHSPALPGLINNAALPSPQGVASPLQECPRDHWDRMMAINMTAPWELTRMILPHMMQSGQVRVLFISSGAGWAATPGTGPYNVSKAALNSLCHCMAQEYVRDFPEIDIQINTLAAGEARTQMNPVSTRSPYSICPMALLLLSHPPGGPNGRFFGMYGQRLAFGETPAYSVPLDSATAGKDHAPPARPREDQGNTYPITIPPIQFESGKEFVLLGLPPMFMPMMPYGLGYVHNILEAAGVDVQTMDLNIVLYHLYHKRRLEKGVEQGPWVENGVSSNDPWFLLNIDEWSKPEALEVFRGELDLVIDALVRARPKILGISLNGKNRRLAAEVIGGVRARHPDVIVVVGGFDCYRHEMVKRNVELVGLFDYMVICEAELSLPGLVRQLLDGAGPRDLPGVVSRHDTPGRQWQPAALPQDLDAIDFPRYEWVGAGIYRTADNQQMVPVGTSRGCKWSRCRFCAECHSFRKRSPKHVVDEVQWHVEQGRRAFNFTESDVNGDPANLLEICREIIRRGIKIWIYAQLRIDRRNGPESFQMLKAAGFGTIRFGVDGWCDHVLRLQRKGYNMKIVEQNLRDCKGAGLRTSVNMVIGVPGETDEDVEETISNVLRLRPYIDVFETLNMMRLFVGSEYFENPEKYGIRFRGDREEVCSQHFLQVSEHLWHSTDPYIDHKVRVERFRAICRALYLGGVALGDFVKWENVEEIGKIEGRKPRSFEEAIGVVDDGVGPAFRHCQWGLELFEKGQADAALAELKKAVQLAPHQHLLHYCRAMVHKKMGLYQQALVGLQRALSLDSENPRYLQQVALLQPRAPWPHADHAGLRS